MKKIDDEYNREDLIEKGIRKMTKAIGQQTQSKQNEAALIKRKEFIKASAPFIKRKEEIDTVLNAANSKKKEVSKPLRAINQEISDLNDEVAEMRKNLDAKASVREDFDKQIDKVKEKRKKDLDERDKLYKSKDALKDTYYGALIEYSKE